MKLVYKDTEKEVQEGDILTDFCGDKAIAHCWKEPTHGEGKISVMEDLDGITSCREYYVSVFGLKWIE